MATDLTTYLNSAKATLGNAAIQNRNYPFYLVVGDTTVKEYREPENTTVATGAEAFTTKLTNTYTIASLPDNIAAVLRSIIDPKLAKAQLNAAKPQ